MNENKTFDKEDLLQRLFAAMGCDDLEMAVLQAELDARESLKAAEAIRQCAGLPENVWPSPHERRFFIALKEHLSATLLTPAWLVRAGGDYYQTWLCNGPGEVRRAFCEALYGDVESAEADDIDGYMKNFSRPWEDREMRWSFEDGWLEVIALHDQTRYVQDKG